MTQRLSTLAGAAERKFGYDGLKRNTYRNAKATPKIAIAKYPFASPTDLRRWLSDLSAKAC